MPKITKIVKQKAKHRYSIFLDDVFSFGIQESVLIKFNLRKGLEIDEQTIQEIKEAEILAKAFSVALNYVSYQERTVRQVENRLTEDQFPEEVINKVLQLMVKRNYINDQRFANLYIQTHMHHTNYGPHKFVYKLKLLGIEAEIIENEIASYDYELQFDNAYSYLEKSQAKFQKGSQFKYKSKMVEDLFKRGFDLDLAKDVVEEFDDLDTELVQENLLRDFERVKRRYDLDDWKEIQKLKAALYRKGYSIDDINKVINDHDDDA